MSEYPEHEKLAAIREQSQAIGEFLDLGRWTLCELREWDDHSPTMEPVNIQDALAEYFGIDQQKIEAEKREMLEALRNG